MSELAGVSCANCGITFGMVPVLLAQRKKDSVAFYCPNGHGNAFTAPKPDELTQLRADLAEASGEATRLQKEVDALKAELEIWRPASAVANGLGMTGERCRDGSTST